ncbi:DUF123 domain-containing protein [bacterium]|nr:DUF123 domain-containing protein [bacterium]
MAISNIHRRTFTGDLKGSYLILIRWRGGKLLSKEKTVELPAGHYLYAGSANGPGGLYARLSRHLRKHKTAHWHIDELTGSSNAEVFATAIVFTSASESQIVESLDFLSCPIEGFGSSDSPHSAHLFYSKEFPLDVNRILSVIKKLKGEVIEIG